MDIDARKIVDSVAGLRKPIEGYQGSDGITYCLKCGKPLEMVLISPKLGINRKVPIMCDCLKKQEAETAERFRRQAIETERLKCFHESRQGLSDRLYNATFDNDAGYNKDAMQIAKGYVNTFDELKTGLLLFGSVGSGKSYIAACICNALIERGHTARFTTFGSIASLAQESFEARPEVMRELQKPDLLVLDDLGAERDTEYMQELVFEVIDMRYRYGRPMVVTTNLSEVELKRSDNLSKTRIFDRLLDACEPVAVNGKSIRRASFKDRHLTNLEKMKGAADVQAF